MDIAIAIAVSERAAWRLSDFRAMTEEQRGD